MLCRRILCPLALFCLIFALLPGCGGKNARFPYQTFGSLGALQAYIPLDLRYPSADLLAQVSEHPAQYRAKNRAGPQGLVPTGYLIQMEYAPGQEISLFGMDIAREGVQTEEDGFYPFPNKENYPWATCQPPSQLAQDGYEITYATYALPQEDPEPFTLFGFYAYVEQEGALYYFCTLLTQEGHSPAQEEAVSQDCLKPAQEYFACLLA